MPDVLLSYHRSDLQSVQKVREILQDEGISAVLDSQNLTPDLPWPQALERAIRSVRAVAVFVGREFGLWQKREMYFAIERQSEEAHAGRSFPVIPVLLPGADITSGFLFQSTWVDLRDDLTSPHSISALVKAIQGDIALRTEHEVIPVCPYQGLRPFREEHAAFFFGREEFSERLLEKTLDARGLLVVTGASGSGKSSVVHAGLLPLLRRQRTPEKNWDIVSFTPGDRPFHRLCSSLMPLVQPAMTEVDRMVEAARLADRLLNGDMQIDDLTELVIARSAGTDRLLIIVDQFEEVITNTPEPEGRKFVESVVTALDQTPRIKFVLTLRADYYGRVIGLNRKLADNFENSVTNLGPMTGSELERAIVNPGKKVGLSFEPGLVGRLLADAGDEPGNLPLLEFALTEVWMQRHSQLMTHAAYETFGGMDQIIGRRAHDELAKLTPEGQASVRKIFTRLVRVGRHEGLEDTRQRVALDELGDKARPLVDRLVSAQLLVTSLDYLNKETVEVSHEALIRKWGDLQHWLNEDREFLIWRQRLKISVLEWHRVQHDDGAFLRGALLAEAERRQTSRATDLNEEETEFIRLSSALQRKELLKTARRPPQRRRDKIFLSYRREDSGHAVDRIYKSLTSRFGKKRIFYDVDTIPIGVDFRHFIAERLEECTVFLVVIGDHWVDIRFKDGPRQGQRRLEDPADPVRIEIETALKAELSVVPVLVGRNSMPKVEELPDSLGQLAIRNAAELSYGQGFDQRLKRLLAQIESTLPPVTPVRYLWSWFRGAR